MSHHLRPAPWHELSCSCTGCNPPVPSVDEPTLTYTIAEMVAVFTFGTFNAWILDRLLDGPGIQIMVGL